MTEHIRDRVRRHIVAVHAPDLAGEPIPDDYDLLANGVVDSLGLFELLEWLGAEFSIRFSDIDVTPADLTTIDSVAGFVATHRADPSVELSN